VLSVSDWLAGWDDPRDTAVRSVLSLAGWWLNKESEQSGGRKTEAQASSLYRTFTVEMKNHKAGWLAGGLVKGAEERWRSEFERRGKQEEREERRERREREREREKRWVGQVACACMEV